MLHRGQVLAPEDAKFSENERDGERISTPVDEAVLSRPAAASSE